MRSTPNHVDCRLDKQFGFRPRNEDCPRNVEIESVELFVARNVRRGLTRSAPLHEMPHLDVRSGREGLLEACVERRPVPSQDVSQQYFSFQAGFVDAVISKFSGRCGERLTEGYPTSTSSFLD